MKLDDVRHADKPQSCASKCQTACDANAATRFVRTLMHLRVHDTPLSSQAVLHPGTLNVNECALALAEQQVLKRRDGEKCLVAEVMVGTPVFNHPG